MVVRRFELDPKTFLLLIPWDKDHLSYLSSKKGIGKQILPMPFFYSLIYINLFMLMEVGRKLSYEM
ncbi:hypothetical protein SAMN05877753_10510 [Bacillus oleivorans]|uniref:Uncharacterized protein n=1 Tax=Bacillus oleivorans TaxID=1448271 RepID=A0A285CVT9_9BACI|nr:hypothetical protein SAMN05877753_10510 [Bacillus oleivorans]